MKELEREILIIGAGPAGISAAIEAAKAGAKVTVADEHDTIGGQLYKQIHKFFGAADNHAGMRGFEIARKLEQEAKELVLSFGSARLPMASSKKASALSATAITSSSRQKRSSLPQAALKTQRLSPARLFPA